MISSVEIKLIDGSKIVLEWNNLDTLSVDAVGGRLVDITTQEQFSKVNWKRLAYTTPDKSGHRAIKYSTKSYCVDKEVYFSAKNVVSVTCSK